ELGQSWISSSYATGTFIQGYPGETVTLMPTNPGGATGRVIHVDGPRYITLKHLRVDARYQDPGTSTVGGQNFVRFDDIDICCLQDNLPPGQRAVGNAFVAGADVEFINGAIHDSGMNIFPPFNINPNLATGGYGFYAFYWGGPRGIIRNSRIYN